MQTMRNIITTVLLTVFTGLHAQQPTLTELYQQIDEAIEQSPKFVADYEAQISRARTVYLQERNAERRMEQAKELYELYRAYNNDSALAYIQQHIALADSLGHTEEADHGRALLAFQCSTVGLYTEALRILQPISSHRLSKEDKCDYYIACMHVYGELGYYTRISSMRDRFFQQSELYRDSIFQVADPNSEDYLLRKETQLYAAKQYEEALAVNSRRLKMAQPGTHEYAIVSYYRHLIYIAQGNTEQGKYWLAQSALCDIRNAVMDQASLLSLAELLNAVRSDRELNVEDILLYTGYTAEELQSEDRDGAVSKVLKLADVLIDGPYIEGQNDGKSPLRGSSNQRILFLHSNTDIEERFRKYLKEKSREAQNFYSGGQIVTVGIPQPGME